MTSLTELEYEILDEAYFVASYHDIKANSGLSPNDLNTGLKTLLQKELLYQLQYDNEQADYVRCQTPDSDHLDQFHYVASKKGLLAHTSP